MKRVLSLLFVLALLPGCLSSLPTSTQPPKAYINAITPAEVTEGGVVTFSGYGTDVDGQVVAYRWRSNRDGQLSATAMFETSSLSVGNHEIYFMVQDNNDAWSTEASGGVTVLPVAVTSVRINAFTVSLASIPRGDSITLAWNVSNATTVSIDHGVGSVSPVGTALVTPESTTTFKLTATGGGSTVAANITVAVQQPASGATLTADGELSGYVRSSGAYTTGFVYAGDDSSDRGIQGYVTFDISSIPDNAVITRVVVDLSDYETPYGSPYPNLGCLSAYVHNYNKLEGSDYWTASLPTPIGRWCNFDDLNTSAEMPGFKNALQQRVGRGTFQFRVQFGDTESDGDGEDTMLRWPLLHLPRMMVEYTF
jgi:hypothetical protein